MLVHDAGVGMMMFGGIVTLGTTVAGAGLQEEARRRDKNMKAEGESFFMGRVLITLI
jgi:hypothetical protein